MSSLALARSLNQSRNIEKTSAYDPNYNLVEELFDCIVIH